MCFSPKAPKDNSAEIAAQQEATRKANITAGQTAIDKNFAQFDDPYYSNITKNYEDYYNPQIDQQYQNALNTLTLQLGQQGILQSSEGDRQLGLLKQADDTQKRTIANNAIGASATAKQQVAQQKNQLYSLNNNAADPSQAASQSAAAAASAVTPPNYSPLGALFAGLVGQGTNALAIQSGQNTGGGFFNQNLGAGGAAPAAASNKSSYVVPE